MAKKKPLVVVADAIREARTHARLTMVQLGAHLGVKPITLSRWESGRVTPRATAQARLVEVLAAIDLPSAASLARALGQPLPKGAEVPRATIALAAFEQAVQLGADTMDLPPRKVRAGFVQLLLQLRAAGVTLDDLSALTTPKS